MADQQDMILTMLSELRAKLKGEFDRMDRRVAKQAKRFDKLETSFDELRAVVYGQLGLGRHIGWDSKPVTKRLRIASEP